MGTIIKSSFTSSSVPPSSIGMAAYAVENCLAQAGMSPQDIDLLINVGVFRDDNIVEPALAPLIQKRCGMNLDPVKKGSLAQSTLSFDINDGPCGFLSAVRVADAFFKSGSAKTTLVVAGDIHPSRINPPDFPFKSVACAVLLTHTEDATGFSNFHFRTSKNGSCGFSASVDLMANGLQGRERMNFTMDDSYYDDLAAFTSALLQEVAPSGRPVLADADYVVTSQQKKGFGESIVRRANPDVRSRVIDLFDEYGDAHTSSLILGYHHLAGGGLLKKNDRILFIGAGSGLSAACSLYTV